MTDPVQRIQFTPQMARALENVASMLRGRGLDKVCEVCIPQMLAEVTNKQTATDAEQVLLTMVNLGRTLQGLDEFASVRMWIRADGWTATAIDIINNVVAMIRKNVALATIFRDAAGLIRDHEAAGWRSQLINAGGLQYVITAAAHKNFPNTWEVAAADASGVLSLWLGKLGDVTALDQWMKQPGIDADGAAFVVESCADQIASI